MAINWKKILVFFSCIYIFTFLFSLLVKLDKPAGSTDSFGVIMAFYMMPMTLSIFGIFSFLHVDYSKFTVYPSVVVVILAFVFMLTGLFVSESVFESIFVRGMIYAHPVLVLSAFYIFDNICSVAKEEEEKKTDCINVHEGSTETTGRGSLA